MSKNELKKNNEEIEVFLNGYFGEDHSNDSQPSGRSQTSRNIGIAVGASKDIDTYSQVMEENFKLFERLDRDKLQGSSRTKHGDAAEALGVKDYNKEQIVKGSGNRMELSSSKTDPRTDSIIRDQNGRIIEKAQTKYYKTPKETADSLSLDRYRTNNAKYAPPEQVAQIKELASKRAKELRAEAFKAKREGNIQEYQTKLRESKNYQHTADTVKGLKRSYKNSKDASANNLSRYKVVGKETLKDAHEAGMKGLKEAAMLSGGISAAQNLTQVVKGEKELGKAVIDTAVDTAKGTAMSYGVKASGAIVKAGAKKAGEQLGSKTLQAFANSARGPALLVTTTLEVGKSLKKYMDGDLDSKDLFIELGEKGTGIIFAEAGTVLGEIVGVSAGAAIGGLIGTFLLPGVGTAGGAAIGAKIGAIAGPIIGSMVGYMVGTQLYQAAKNLLSSYDSEKQRRLKAIYEQAYERMKAERLEMERLIEQHFADRYAMFRQGFQAMEEAILENNVHKVSNELNDILGAFGETLQFKNFKQFDDFMLDDDMVLKL